MSIRPLFLCLYGIGSFGSCASRGSFASGALWNWLSRKYMLSDRGSHLRSQEFNGPHHLGVGHCSDTHLRQETAVAEELILKKHLLDNLLRAAYQ